MTVFEAIYFRFSIFFWPAKKATKTFAEKLVKIVEDGGYIPQEAFNADETGLLSKKMLSRSYIVKSKKKIQVAFKINLASQIYVLILLHKTEKLRNLSPNFEGKLSLFLVIFMRLFGERR